MDASTIDRLSDARVLVVGDVILDRFVQGHVARVSREAPVPVLTLGQARAHPGGACNVAANILSCGGLTTLVGLTGEDDAARELGALCAGFPGMSAELIGDPDRPTTVKTRYLSGWQQLLCVDTEERRPAAPAVAGRLGDAARRALPAAGALVLSDYGRGALAPGTVADLIAQARRAETPVVVDPRQDDPGVYAGASVVTPNLAEMERFTGIRADSDDDAAAACAKVLESAELDAVLLTRGAAGMTLVRRGADAAPLHVRARTQQVFDVTGAGDTVVAVLAAALASGAPIEDAVELANAAAGVVVATPGTAVVHPRELRQALGAAGSRGVVEAREAAEIVSLWQSLGLKIAFTNGIFDLLHRGHLYSLDNAAGRGDRLVVGVNSDASTARIKGPGRPIQDAETRATVLAALGHVDLVVVFDEDTPEELIRAVKPDLLLKGADYEGVDIPGAAFVEENGGAVELLPLLEGFSTSGTIRRIEDAAGK